MSILKTIKGWIDMILKRKAKDEFNVDPATSSIMEEFVAKCMKMYQGKPYWLDDADGIKTINFAKSICTETARLATLAIGIKVEGSARAEWLQEQIDAMYSNLRHYVEYGLACGTVVLKPNGKSVDLFTPDRFLITEQENGVIRGIVFLFNDKTGDDYYTRLEYHRWADNGTYLIDNRCYRGKSENDTTHRVDIDSTPWAGLVESAGIAGIDKPLYGVFKTPSANNIDIGSPLGMPIFADAIEELRDLDIAYSRNMTEIEESRRTVLMDSDKLLPFGASPLGEVARLDRATANSMMQEKMKLPKFVRMVDGSSDGNGNFYQEINPMLNTGTRLDGINAILSQIAYKVGFSNGYFVFNEKTGIQTATGVEAEQQRTIQFIKDVRDRLQACMDDLIYAMSAMADLYEYAPSGEYEVVYDFGDITYNEDEDRARWWQYVMANKVPAWMFFVKFEGMIEDEAKEMIAEATPVMPTLFDAVE